MLTFEITKTNTALPQKGLAPILIAPPHTYIRQRLVLWNKAKPMLLTYREETEQPWRPIAGLPAPWVLSSAGKLIQYLHGSYFLPCRNTVSTPDASGAMVADAKFQMIFNDRFVASSVDRPWQDNCRVWCRHGVSLLLFRRCFPLLFFFICHLYLSVVARLMSVMCTERSLLASWVDTPLTADWLQVCFGTGPVSVF